MLKSLIVRITLDGETDLSVGFCLRDDAVNLLDSFKYFLFVIGEPHKFELIPILGQILSFYLQDILEEVPSCHR